ncbi:hypothetical protein MMC30_005627 [Trapelia coarctata]|nr:hypothetical protein [Trapelia coarctata]
MLNFWLYLLAFLAVVALWALTVPARRASSLPPGPPTLPVLGNLHQLPKTGAHFLFTKWASQYGGIFSLKIGPATAVVISSRKLVKDLLDRKAAIYSGRPKSYILDNLVTRGDHILFMRPGDKWRLLHKLIHQQFNETRCEREYITLQNAEAVQMLRDFCLDPGELMNHPKRFSNSIIMALGEVDPLKPRPV